MIHASVKCLLLSASVFTSVKREYFAYLSGFGGKVNWVSCKAAISIFGTELIVVNIKYHHPEHPRSSISQSLKMAVSYPWAPLFSLMPDSYHEEELNTTYFIRAGMLLLDNQKSFSFWSMSSTACWEGTRIVRLEEADSKDCRDAFWNHTKDKVPDSGKDTAGLIHGMRFMGFWEDTRHSIQDCCFKFPSKANFSYFNVWALSKANFLHWITVWVIIRHLLFR